MFEGILLDFSYRLLADVVAKEKPGETGRLYKAPCV
jgi:hypothetical protein